MSRPNDIGGRPGFGPIPQPDGSEPVFHADWEGRLFGMILATRGNWTIDMFKGARERDAQDEYLRRGYFANFLAGFERVLAESGLVTAEELATGRAESTRVAAPVSRPPGLEWSFMPRPKTSKPARFKIGDRVRGAIREPRGHTRQPGYVQGRVGVIVEDHGVHRFPDLSAEGVIEGQHLYTVSFEAGELWGDNADGRGAVLVDLFDDYLEPAA